MGKKRISLLFAFGIFLVSQIAPASTPASPDPTRPDCIADPNDPFDHGQVMWMGDYEGQCMDTSQKRPAVVVRTGPDFVEFANFRHGGRFWYAKTPTKGVERIIFQIEYSDSPVSALIIAHIQLRFVMNERFPLVLRPQARGDNAAPVVMKDFVLSTDYMAPKGVSYNVVNGALANFTLAKRFVSSEDRVAELIKAAHHQIEQWDLRIDPSDRNRILKNAIYESQKADYGMAYDTIFQNCGTEAFKALDDTLDYPGKTIYPFELDLSQPLDMIAGPSKVALRERDLIDDSRQLPDWNQELGLEY